MYPLRTDQKYYNVDRIHTSAGKVPWVGLNAVIIKGPHKAKDGIVKDVNRTQNIHAISGLMVVLELNVMGSPLEHVYYDHVRERHTGLTLAGYHPLRDQEAFFRPNPKFVGAGVKLGPRTSRFLSLSRCVESQPDNHGSATGGLVVPDLDAYAAMDVSILPSVNKSRILYPGDEGLVIPDLDPHALMDVWNLYWEYPGSPRVISPPSPPRSASTKPTKCSPVQDRYEAAAQHMLARPELVGVSLLVDIQKGPHKKAAVYVKLSHTSTGAIIGILRKGKGKRKHEICLVDIALSHKHVDAAKDDHLLVMIGGAHLGKLVRRICGFYVSPAKTPDTKWLVLAVVDKEKPVDQLTGELIECAVEELAFVEETPTDCYRATQVTMSRLRGGARLKMSREVRNPNEGDLDCLKTVIDSQFPLHTAGPSK